MNLLSKAIALAISIAAPAISFAAREFTPQAGTWVMTDEVNGKPGRGLAIDVQGNTLFSQIFAYDKSGQARFYTATSPLVGYAATADLKEYEGGRYLGSDGRVAEEAGSPGQVQFEFTSGISGKVKFPDEDWKPIERFRVSSIQDAPEKFTRSAVWFELDQTGNPIRSLDVTFSKEHAESDLEMSLDNYQGQKIKCPSTGEKFLIRCSGIVKNIWDGYEINVTAEVYESAHQYAGIISFQSKSINSVNKFMGYAVVSTRYGEDSQSFLAGDVDGGQEGEGRMPSNGTWVVSDELNGLPGRGLAIDVQDNIAILQMYNYNPDGTSTFHMGTGEYRNSRFYMPIYKYKNGPYFGGSSQVGVVEAAAGNVEFELDIAAKNTDIAYIVLPNEKRVRIERLAFDAPTSTVDSLAGTWIIGNGMSQTFVTLHKTDDQTVASQDGKTVCRFKDPSNQMVECVSDGLINVNYGRPGKTSFKNNAAGVTARAIKIRDRSNNLLSIR